MYLLPCTFGDLDCPHAIVICDSFDLICHVRLGWCMSRNGSSAPEESMFFLGTFPSLTPVGNMFLPVARDRLLALPWNLMQWEDQPLLPTCSCGG